MKIFSYLIPFAGVICECTNIFGEADLAKEELEEFRGILFARVSEVEHTSKQEIWKLY